MTQILRLTFRPRRILNETWVTCKNQNISVREALLEEDGLAAVDGENFEIKIFGQE